MVNKVSYIVFFLVVILGLSGLAQQNNLPNFMLPEEEALIPEYKNSRAAAAAGITTPPGGNLRSMGEWEEIQSLVITWTSYTSILRQIVDHAQQECEVIVICSDSNQVKNYLTSGGVSLNNVSYIEAPYNSIWGRDYGANTCYKNHVDSLYLVDWIYNRPRPNDDAVPQAVAGFKNIPLYETSVAPYDLVHTGGNFMSDGFGNAFSSNLVLEENDQNGQFNTTARDSAGVVQIMNEFMGVHRYVLMETLPFDGIHHIDMHMKLLDEETLLWSEYPTGVADGPQIETNLDYVQNNFNSMFGSPYEVVRIPAPPSTGGNYPDAGGYYRTYTNSVFVNGTLIVPTYRQEYDTIALRILRENLPGYNVVGIDCDNSGSAIIAASGAIHCITKAVGVEDPLLISHKRLRDTYNSSSPYAVNAFIKHKSGIVNATLYWSTDTVAGYQTVTMNDLGNDYWEGNIPAQQPQTQVFYYVHATANSGKQQVRPIVAPKGYWQFRVLGTVGAQEITPMPKIDIYPNPSAVVACVEVESWVNLAAQITVHDVLGKHLFTLFRGKWQGGNNKFYIDTSKLDNGIYLVTVKMGHTMQVKKLVVK